MLPFEGGRNIFTVKLSPGGTCTQSPTQEGEPSSLSFTKTPSATPASVPRTSPAVKLPFSITEYVS